jgi:hypothetical protein
VTTAAATPSGTVTTVEITAKETESQMERSKSLLTAASM